MSNTYSWAVQAMQCYPTYQELTNVVFIVNSLVTATDQSWPPIATSLEFATSIVYNPNDPFIPYDQLTLDIVNQWVKDALGVDGVNNIQSTLDSQIEIIVNPPAVSLPLPWSS